MKKQVFLKKWGGSFKYIIPSIVVLILIGAIIIGRFLPKQLLGSVYSIDELKENFSKVRVGDTINYEINGYSDWQVLYTDIDNGTIDVVSKTNTEDLTLEPNQTKEYYENKFQEIANKYIDNNYVINTRTVNQSDLDYFNYDNDFWLNNVTEDTITSSKSSWQYTGIKNYKMYLIPYVEKHFENYNEYNVGDTIEYSNNGVDRWVVAEVREWNSTLILIPETPIELVIESADDDINEKGNQIINAFNNDVSGVGNYVSDYGTGDLPNLIPNILNQQSDKIYFIGNSCWYKENGKIIYNGCGSTYYYENGSIGNYTGVIWQNQNPQTLGFRPVITLKVKEAKEGKDLSSKIKVGDNVKYEAKGYKNWKVLSIDEDNNTIDIISGGIVKNLTLSGKEDWENFEDILQKETDKYKNGDNVVGTKLLESYDIKLLEQIRDKVTAKYFINSAVLYKNDKFCSTAAICKIAYYTVNALYYDGSVIQSSKISLYGDTSGNSEQYKDYYGQSGSKSYTAGLRPIITLKLDKVEKMSDADTKKVEESSKKLDKSISREQTSKNKNYKAPSIVDDTSSKGTKKDNNTKDIDKSNKNNVNSDNENNKSINNSDATNDLKAISKGLFWYIIISVSLLNILVIAYIILNEIRYRK